MIPEVIVAALLLGWLLKGKLSRLEAVKIRHSWLIAAAFGLFAVGLVLKFAHLAPQASPVYVVLHYMIIVMFLALAAANRYIPGVKLILLGLALNAVAIAANGGFMPATPEAIVKVFNQEHLEKMRHVAHVKHTIADENTKLIFLTDIIPIPRPYLFLKGIFSIGDMLMSSGIFVAIISIMRRPLPSEKPVSEEA